MNSERVPSKSTPAGLTLHRYSGEEARDLRKTIEEIYAGSYVEAIASGHSFDSVSAFMMRFDAYTANLEFDMVIAHQADGAAVGQTWGWPLRSNTGWWGGLTSQPEPDFTREDGRRTFALSEIMVVKNLTGGGVAHALHDKLLSIRTEERATLLVEPENVVARVAYLHWGWRKVAQLRPGWDDAPLFDVLTMNLGPTA